MGIQSFLIFGDICQKKIEGYGIFCEKFNGIWDTRTPPSRASLVLLMHLICTEWHTEATERRKYECHAFYVPQKLKLTS